MKRSGRKDRWFSCLVILMLMGCFFPALSKAADPLDNWHWRNPLPDGNSLNAITYNNGLFVAVGNQGTVITSTDKITWIKRETGTAANIFDVIFANNLFVAVTWGNLVLTSPDGIVWTKRDVSFDSSYGVAYGNGKFVVASWNENTILTSTDGISWSKQTTTISTSSLRLRAIDYIDGLFIVDRSYEGVNTQLSSTDGINWTQCTATISLKNKTSIFAGGAYVKVGLGGYIAFSSDGNNWTLVSSGVYDRMSSVAYGNSTFVAVSNLKKAYISYDGLSWTGNDTDIRLNRIKFNDGIFIAVGAGAIVTSTDGIIWTTQINGLPTLRGVTYGGGLYIAVGNSGTIYTSPDTKIWTQQTSNTSANLYEAAYGNGIYVVVGADDTILTSTDSIVWTKRDSNIPQTPGIISPISNVIYNAGIFVISGLCISISTDGINWTQAYPGGDVPSLAYGNNTFIAGVGYGNIFTSPNGINWTQRNSPTGNWLYGITYGRGTFVAVGEGGTIIQSDPIVPQSSLTITITGFGSGVVTSSPAGISCGGRCTTTFDKDSVVTLTAVPSTNYVFTGWSGGGCSETETSPTCQVTMDTAKIIIAGFTLKNGTITGRVSANVLGYTDLGVRIATITLQGTGYSTTPDADGNFSLQSIPYGDYTLVISAPNMETVTEYISVSGGSLQVSLPAMTISAAACGVKGDVNDDGHLSLEDAFYILQVLSGTR